MKISIIGESHVRGYRDRRNIYPLFIGAGKQVNLFVENCESVILKIISANRKYPSDIVYLSLGEPNCRHQLGHGWYPHDLDDVEPIVNKEVIDGCITNYKLLLDRINLPNLYILTASACFEPELPSINYFNTLLLENFGDKCVDLTDVLLNFEYYRGHDAIHLNTNVSDLFLSKIHEMGHIDSIDDFPHEEHITQDFGCIRLW